MTSITAPRRDLTLLEERFIRSGFKGLDELGIIELLLGLTLRPRESRRLAEECLKCFENLGGFLAASSKELQQLGITPKCIFCIKFLRDLPAEVLKQEIITKTIYTSSKEIFDYLYYSMRGLKKEIFRVIHLNNRSQIIDIADLFEGTTNSIHIRPREIVESAIKHNAGTLIFVHNHPSGEPSPSRTDKQLTKDLVFIGNILQIKVIDHIIIGANRYFSFADEGLIQKYEDSFLTIKIRSLSERQTLRYRKTGLLPLTCVKAPVLGIGSPLNTG